MMKFAAMELTDYRVRWFPNRRSYLVVESVPFREEVRIFLAHPRSAMSVTAFTVSKN